MTQKFQKFVLRKMNFLTRASSSQSPKGVSRRIQDSDINLPRNAEVRPCEWPHIPFMSEAGFYEEFMHFVANAGLTSFFADKFDQHYLLTNSFMQKFYFVNTPGAPMVRFALYAENYELPLHEFCEICLLPSDGGVREPKAEEFEDFIHNLTVEETRGVSHARASSLHFPSMHYFSLVIGKCITAMEQGGGLSAPTLAILHRALCGDNTYNLGAIFVCRLHLN